MFSSFFKNGQTPVISNSLNRQYVIGVKLGDHNYLFDWIKDSKPMVHQYTDDVGTQPEFHAYLFW
jgi:hypothetical protein